MKISKVNHTKSAVVIKNEIIQGKLYTDPNKGVEDSIVNSFNKLNRTAQRLYGFFNPVNVGTEPRKPEKKDNPEVQSNYEIKKKNYDRRVEAYKFINGDRNNKGFNKLLEGVFFKFENGRKILVENESEIIEKIKKQRQLPPDNIKIAKECIVLYLRKSLRSEQNNLNTIVSAFGNQNADKNDKIKKAVKAFTPTLAEDFNKKIQGNNIEKSITNQNMPLQPQNDSFMLSENNKGSRNQTEKKGLQNFIINYADLDETKRMEMLRSLRRLVDLYFFSTDELTKKNELPEQVDTSNDFDVWKKHEDGKKNTDYFVVPPKSLKEASENDSIMDSVEFKKAKDELDAAIRKRNAQSYRNAKKLANIDDKNLFFNNKSQMNEFWIHHIENAVERILKSVKEDSLFKLQMGYLTEKVWKDLINLISVKYIATGKVVYNFAMTDLMKKGESINLGIIPGEIKKGLTSFDYEKIKAEETLQREISVAISFAANNLARATVDTSGNKEEDFLLYKEDEIKENLIKKEEGKTLKAILQFFGGCSSWTAEELALFKNENEENYEVKFLLDCKEMIYSLRNENFHFTTANTDKDKWNTDLVAKMFKKETAAATVYAKEKFYSNNLSKFYNPNDLEKLLDFLYAEYHQRASQVPAFNNVIIRKNFTDYLKESLKCDPDIKDNNDKFQCQSAVYYAFKEIYYNAFLPDKEAKCYFSKALKNYTNTVDKENDDKKKRATKDFNTRYDEIKEKFSLSEICQIIMTEYNAQNTSKRKAKSALDNNPAKKEKFQHYKMILLKTLGDAFALYVKEKKETKFLVKDIIVENDYGERDAIENFLPKWKTSMYDDLAGKVKEKNELQKWYITGRFLNSKILNHLAGSFRSYVQYIDDIERRAKENNNLLKGTSIDNERVREILEVLDFCRCLSGRISNNYQDYFDDEEDYARYLSGFIDISEESASSDLCKFCNSADQSLGIYMDGKNPIPNRNIIMSKLFAPYNILKKTVKPITRYDIKDYYVAKGQISSYKVIGLCENKKDQAELIGYQQKINRIEFRTIIEYGEMINDLLGQLINWSYLRERDLLYFQLGFHYMCLNNPNAEKPELYKKVELHNGTQIDNVILYQIAAMYINGLALVKVKNNKFVIDEKAANANTGSKWNIFTAYSEALLENSDININNKAHGVYLAGLEIFENTKEHDKIIKLRNAIDHFHYYSESAGSLLDLYSEVFDRFFTYDMKYQKTVVNRLYDILLKYFIITNVKFGTGKKMMDDEKEKECARIEIADNGISSDKMTYKLSGTETPDKEDARGEEYLNDVINILYYPKELQGNKLKEGKKERKQLKVVYGKIYEAKVKKVEGNSVKFTITNGDEHKDGSAKDAALTKNQLKSKYIKDSLIKVMCSKDENNNVKWVIEQ